MVETATKSRTKIEIDQDISNNPYLELINSNEFYSLPAEERMDLIFSAHRGKKIDAPLFPREIEIIKEYLDIENQEPDLDITISGLSYAGKNSLADLVAQITKTEHWDGKERFDRREKDAAETEKVIHSEQEHLDFDEFQRQDFRQTELTKKGRVKQARLAGIAYAETADEYEAATQEREAQLAKKRQRRQDVIEPEPIPPLKKVVSFLIEASDKVRVDRAYAVAKRKAKAEGKSEPTREKIANSVNQRDKDNIEKWTPGHEYYLSDGNPMDPDLTRPNGLPVYQFIINMTKRTPLEGAVLLLKRYKEAGGFREKSYAAKVSSNKDMPVELTDELEEVREILGWPMPDNFADLDDLEKALIKGYEIEAEENSEKEDENSNEIPENDVIFDDSKMEKKKHKKPHTNGHGRRKSTRKSGTFGGRTSKKNIDSGQSVGEPTSRKPSSK